MKLFMERIDEHIREEGIPFKQITIPSSYLPTYINYAIMQKMNEDIEAKEMFWPNEYTLEYDSKNRILLKAVSHTARTSLLIYSLNDYLSNVSDDIGHKMSDSYLYNYALILKYYKNVRERVYSEIDKKYGKTLSPRQKNKIRYYAMHDFYEEKYHELGSDIRKLCSLEEELNKSVDLINSYIDYLNKTYQEDMEAYRDERTVYIFYEEKENNNHKEVVRTGIKSHKQRKNKVISMDERREVLEDYDYEYFGIATARNKVKKDFYCYLYKDYENRNILVLEPYCGTKYTKVIYLDTRDLSKEEFKEICTKALELSNEETFNHGNIIRLGHTTLDVFTSNIKYILSNINETKCKDNFKERVRTNRNKIHV